MNMIKATLFFTTILLLGFTCPAQPSAIWGGLQKGKYDVGFKALYEFDYSRVYHQPHAVSGAQPTEETARPIRAFVWYPASPKREAKMKYSDYVSVKPPDARFNSFNAAINSFDLWATTNWTNQKDSSINTILNQPVEAYRDAKPLQEKFPLIVHFIGLNNRRNENIPFWEYLASHGYVVLTVPQYSGAGDVSMELWGFSEWGKETQVRDMEFAMSMIHEWPNVDFTRIGAVGFSYGSVFALRLAMLNFNVKALVTWDGNVNNKNGHRVLESFYNPKLKVDWLNIHRSKYESLDLKIHETLKYTNRYRVTYPSALHADFEDVAIANTLLPSQAPAYALQERSLSAGKKYYETTCSLTLGLFNQSLKRVALPTIESQIETNRKEKTILEVDIRKASKVIDEEDLAHIIIYYGIAEAEKTYKRIIDDNSYEVLVTSVSLVDMAKALRMGGRRIEKSNDVLRFAELNFPANTTVYLELARNFIELKDKAPAKKYLNKVLGLEPNHEEAKALLKLIN